MLQRDQQFASLSLMPLKAVSIILLYAHVHKCCEPACPGFHVAAGGHTQGQQTLSTLFQTVYFICVARLADPRIQVILLFLSPISL